jgi:hypothetical protein
MKGLAHDDVRISTNDPGRFGHAEGGTTAEVWQQVGIAEQTFYTWKRKYSALGLN